LAKSVARVGAFSKTKPPQLPGCSGHFCFAQLNAHNVSMDKNDLPWVMSYLAALTGVFWLGRTDPNDNGGLLLGYDGPSVSSPEEPQRDH
jgi:hypothetical protein